MLARFTMQRFNVLIISPLSKMASVLFQRAMDNQLATSSTRSLLVRFWPWLVVAAILLFVGFIRVRLLEMPLERDEGEYAYAGQLILQGIPPYELAYNMKLPGTYYAYAAGMAIFGQTIAGVHLTLLVANALTIIFVFLLARKLFGIVAGLIACASYGVMSLNPVVLGAAAHANHFVVLFAVPATLLLWKCGESNERRTFFFTGLLYGMAFLMKQQGICFCLFGAVFLLWQAAQRNAVLNRSFLGNFLVFGSGMILPFAFFCLSTVVAGDLKRFWFWTFIYAGSYEKSTSIAGGVDYLKMHLDEGFAISVGLWTLGIFGLPAAWLDKSSREQAAFALLFWLFSFFGAAMGFYFRAHYFILILPAFAVLLGMSVRSWQQYLQSKKTAVKLGSVPLILFVTLLGWNVFLSRDFLFQSSPIQLTQRIYTGNPFIESLIVAQYIREHSPTNALVAVVGSEPEIYFYAQRHSATGYIYTYALEETQPYADKMQREMISEIESNKPEYLVLVMYKLSWLLYQTSDFAVFRWFAPYSKEFYEPVGFVGIRPNGEGVSLWGNAAANHFHDPLEQVVVVYKRKDTAFDKIN
jgi:hypothetical protein